MGRIRVLPDQVANKIAAGEVVERPASVVKELLENSLDAGATEFRIEIETGGRRLIRITDDGCGMLRDDAMLAFERHATSKLRDVKDLLSIATLGFRGEALPSIASVSRLLLETRARRGSHRAPRSRSPAARCCAAKRRARPRAPSITVRDLFFNVPARKKFLRSEQTELAHIASLVTHYSLAHPDKTFQLIERRQRTAARHAGRRPCASASTRSSAARCWKTWSISATRSANSAFRRPACRLRKPSPSSAASRTSRPPTSSACAALSRARRCRRRNRNSIFIFVNGRLIRDRLLLHAISSAYHNLMPRAGYPVRAAVSGVRLRRSRRQRASFEDRSSVPASVVRARFRARRDPRTLIESRPAPAFSPCAPPTAQPAARCLLRVQQMLENEAPRRVAMPEPADPAAPPVSRCSPQPGSGAALRLRRVAASRPSRAGAPDSPDPGHARRVSARSCHRRPSPR